MACPLLTSGRWGMLTVETIGRIRRERVVKGKSIKEIDRDMKVSRNTVRKVLRSGATAFEYEREVQPRPKLGRWMSDLEDLLLATIRQIEQQGAIARGGPEPQSGQKRRQARTAPKEDQVEETGIPGAKEHAHTVDRCCQEQRQEVFGEKKHLQGEDHVEGKRPLLAVLTGSRSGGGLDGVCGGGDQVPG